MPVLPGGAADERRQIGEGQVLRHQLGGEELGLLGLVDQDVAGEIAVAHMPLGVDELPQAGLALELAADAGEGGVGGPGMPSKG